MEDTVFVRYSVDHQFAMNRVLEVVQAAARFKSTDAWTAEDLEAIRMYLTYLETSFKSPIRVPAAATPQ